MTEKSLKIRFFNIWVILVFDLVLRVAGDFQADALMALKNSLVDPDNVLEQWSASLSDPCVWLHVTCSDHSVVTHIELGDANLSGQLAIELGQLSNLQYLELYGNNITGAIPEQLGNLTELESLDLYSNKLDGPIPSTLGNLKKLRFLRLNNNNLSGEVPRSLTTISTLVVLDLSKNQLTGSIPSNGSFVRFTPLSFSGNNSTSSPPSQLPPTSPTPSGTRNRNTGVIAGGIAAGAGLLFVVLCIVLAWQRRRKRRDNNFFDVPGEQDPEVHLGQLKRFSLHELLVASDHFNNKNLVGKGGFGKVYKARLADGSLVAIKRLLEAHIQGGELQFQNEVELISVAVHRNLLRLCGFCMTPTERLLVYPFMANGSVASYLRERQESQPPLDWSKRKNIALGSARGLAYLHDHCDPKIIHRDVKAANILLDDEFEAVIGDFGLAKLMDYKETFVTTAIHGTPGHIAPEYLSTGKSSVKVDVFGYGIMLLELITGQRAPELAQLASENDDLRFEWVKGLLKEKKLDTIVDANLEGNYVVEEVEQLTQVALLCTQSSPMERPYMSEVIRMLQGDGLAERWEEREKEEMFRQDNYNYRSYNQTDTDWVIGDTITNIENESLSGPR